MKLGVGDEMKPKEPDMLPGHDTVICFERGNNASRVVANIARTTFALDRNGKEVIHILILAKTDQCRWTIDLNSLGDQHFVGRFTETARFFACPDRSGSVKGHLFNVVGGTAFMLGTMHLDDGQTVLDWMGRLATRLRT